jgi:cytidylate kinase
MAAPRIITLSGLPGTGTSTACSTLCKGLGWAYVNAGEIFRQLARESGLDLADFDRRAEADGRIDRQLDERMMARARAQAPIVVEGRLTGWMAHCHGLEALKIWLEAALEVRVARVAHREGKSEQEAQDEMLVRQESEARRYEEFHGIRIGDLSIYDLVLDTGHIDSEAVVAQVLERLRAQ